MKTTIAAALFLVVFCVGVVTPEFGLAKDKKAKGKLIKVTLRGRITKTVKKGRGSKVITRYVLTDDEGVETRLPQAKPAKRKKKDGSQAKIYKLDDYLDVDVIVLVQGVEIESDDDDDEKDKDDDDSEEETRRVHVRRILSIEKAGE